MAAATKEEVAESLAAAKIPAEGLSMKDLAARTGLPESRLIRSYYKEEGVVVKVGRSRFRGADGKPAAEPSRVVKARQTAQGRAAKQEADAGRQRAAVAKLPRTRKGAAG